MNTIIPMQNQNFSGNPEEPTEVPGADEETKSIGGVVPRAENVGDLKTTDHKVLSEGCESRNSHRYVVVVQDLAT